MKSVVRIVFALALFIPSIGSAQDSWPEFRGPTGDGMATSEEIPTEFSETKNVKWKTAIHGKGWSSPVVFGNQIWLTTATDDGKQMSAISLDLESGAVLTDQVVFANSDPDFCHPMNSYATPTPVIEDGRVYVHFGKYGTACFDTETGKRIWERRDFECDHFRGPGSSPILFENTMIVAFDGFDQQYVVALNKETGETIWKTDRDIDYGTDNGDQKKAYCTGLIATVNDKPLLIYPSAVATEAFDPRTGGRKWIARHGGMNASARPLMTEDGVAIIANGMGQMVGVRADGEGDVTDTHVEWKLSKGASKKASQLLIDGLLLMVSDDGILTCISPGSDQPQYRHRLDGSFAASPVSVGGHVYLPSIEGHVYVLKSGGVFQMVSRSKLGDGFMASPAIVGGKLILRSKSHLYCIEKAE